MLIAVATRLHARVVGRGLARPCQRALSVKVFDMLCSNPGKVDRLPIPDLDHTMDRYLQSVRAVVADDTEFMKHAAVTREFWETDGPELHADVIRRDKRHTAEGEYPFSYIEDSWDNMYRNGRWALPINSNPFYMLKDSPDPNQQEQCARAARFVTSAAKWARKLLRGGMEFDGTCMSQFPLQVSNQSRELASPTRPSHCTSAIFTNICLVCVCDGAVRIGAHCPEGPR